MCVFISNYNVGEFVYLITCKEQTRRMITSIEFYLNGSTTYRLSCGNTESYHMESEFSRTSEI